MCSTESCNKKILGKDVNLQAYPWIKLSSLTTRRFSKEILREAVDLLLKNKHIDMLDNQLDRFDIQIKCTDEGARALREGVYHDDIRNYRDDKISKWLNWRVGLVGILLAICSFVYTVFKDHGKSTNTERTQSSPIKSDPKGQNPKSTSNDIQSPVRTIPHIPKNDSLALPRKGS
ncbi:hypothetical protein ACQ86N_21925 [Puia sp. P3]|uniref:hypothetical protein n=1 Tax=Puia sp. P3 TaxID=3423952 RepID=UPI003D671CD5